MIYFVTSNIFFWVIFSSNSRKNNKAAELTGFTATSGNLIEAVTTEAIQIFSVYNLFVDLLAPPQPHLRGVHALNWVGLGLSV